MSRRLTSMLVIVVALSLALPALAQTTQRELDEFIQAQGQTGGDNPPSYVPPDPNFIGITTIIFPPPDRGWGKKSSPIYFAGVDYAGLAATYENGLGTNPLAMQVPEITGTVTERPLPDGTAEITVIMHTKGANIWVIELGEDYTLWGDEIAGAAPTLFGYRPRDVTQGAKPALADTLLHIVFIISAPGAPLPDLLSINYTPAVKFFAFTAHGEGPLTNAFIQGGASGKCTIVQTGLFGTYFKNFPPNDDGTPSSPNRVAFDIFPVENIKLQVVGKGK